MNTFTTRLLRLASLALVIIGFTAAPAARAGYGAGVVLTSNSYFGAIGVSGQYGSSSAAVNAARSYAGSTSSAYKGQWWSTKGYGAAARGYTSNTSSRKLYSGFAWGYKTSNSAKNAALSKLPSSAKFSRAWVSYYNQ